MQFQGLLSELHSVLQSLKEDDASETAPAAAAAAGAAHAGYEDGAEPAHDALMVDAS